MIARIFLVMALLMPSIALAIAPGEALDNPVLEERARDLSKQLRCLTCQNNSIDESPSDIAKDLRILVRERLVAGDSDNEVLDFVVARYGEFALLKPRIGLHTILLWLSPLLFMLLGGLFIWQLRRNSHMANEAELALDEDEKAALDNIRSQ